MERRTRDEELGLLGRCVDEFAGRMKVRLKEKHDQGARGWLDPAWASSGGPCVDRMRTQLEKVAGGQWEHAVDVANFAMFIWTAQSLATAEVVMQIDILAGQTEAESQDAKQEEVLAVGVNGLGTGRVEEAAQNCEQSRLSRVAKASEACVALAKEMAGWLPSLSRQASELMRLQVEETRRLIHAVRDGQGNVAQQVFAQGGGLARIEALLRTLVEAVAVVLPEARPSEEARVEPGKAYRLERDDEGAHVAAVGDGVEVDDEDPAVKLNAVRAGLMNLLSLPCVRPGEILRLPPGCSTVVDGQRIVELCQGAAKAFEGTKRLVALIDWQEGDAPVQAPGFEWPPRTGPAEAADMLGGAGEMGGAQSAGGGQA